MNITVTIQNPSVALLAYLAGLDGATVTNEPSSELLGGLTSGVQSDDDETLNKVTHHTEEEKPNFNAPDVDANGYPWDQRIHSAGKSLIADGTWRYKKGIAQALIDEVEAEFQMATLGGSEPEAPAEMTFETLLSKISQGKIQAPIVLKACQNQGLTAIPQLRGNPVAIAGVAAELGLS